MPEVKMDSSARALVDHWKWAADKGVMNPTTANALRGTCTQVLSVLDGWEQIDVAQLDVEDAFRRFQNKRGKEFTPKSLETYRSRFTRAVRSFLDYVESPTSWKATSHRVATHKQRDRQAETAAMAQATPSIAAIAPALADRQRFVEYPFPLREGRLAVLRLPADLCLADVRRLNAFLTTVAIDFDPDAT